MPQQTWTIRSAKPWIDRVGAAAGVAICLLVVTSSGRALADDIRARPVSDVLQVLIITGQGDHDWRATVPFLRHILADTGRFDVRVCEAPAGLTARTLAGFDVLVDDCGASASDSETGKAIAGFVETGKGLVVTHGAFSFCKSVHARSGDNQEVQSGSFGMVPSYWPALPSGGSPPPVQFFEVKIAQPEHPIARDIKSGFRIADTVERGMSVRPGADVIATAHADAGTGGARPSQS